MNAELLDRDDAPRASLGQDGQGRARLDVGPDGAPGLTRSGTGAKEAWSAP